MTVPLPTISKAVCDTIPCTSETNKSVSDVFGCRLSPIDVSYEEFFREYLLQNRPCIFSEEVTRDWRSRRDWVDRQTGKPLIPYLRETFGEVEAPVANCGKEKFSSQCKEDMKMSHFLDYWENYISAGHQPDQKCLYLKDWHFTKAFPSYPAYTTPEYFLSDWMNEFWDGREDAEDDYRFVYMGPKGSWTPFHADVFRSYSWSANICGRKRWIFIPPGEEKSYRDKLGNLVYDINSDALNDPILYPGYSQSVTRIEVIQEPGEVIFVPSGWHHQVHNIEDTISINHNWMNGCNVARCWSFVKQNLSDVQREIADCRDMEGWHAQCQLVLKASSGIDYAEFFRFMVTIATHRMDFLKQAGKCDQHRMKVTMDSEQEQGRCCQGDGNVTNVAEADNLNKNLDHTEIVSHVGDDEIHIQGKDKLKSNPNLSSADSKDTTSCKRCDDTVTCHSLSSSDASHHFRYQECGACPKDYKINTGEGDTLFDTQHDSKSTCQKACDCNVQKEVANSLSGDGEQAANSLRSSNHATFDLIQVKHVLVDMMKTEEFSKLLTDPDAVTVIDKISNFIP